MLLCVGAHGGHELIGHAAQHGFDILFVRLVFGEGLLLAVGLGGARSGTTGRSSMPLAKSRSCGAPPPSSRASSSVGRGGDLPDFGQAGGVEALGGLGPDAGQPAIGQRMQERDFLSGRHVDERGGFVQFGGDLADQLAAAEAFADGDLERLPDGLADGFGDLERGICGRPVRSK